MPPLVPDRSCGECTVCCEAPIIDTPQLKKLPGVLCPHCVRGQGCAIYAQRPPGCRDWHCLWRQAATLDESWRPDKSGILVMENLDGIPTGYGQRGMVFELLDGDAAKAAWPPLIEEVIRFIGARVPIYLSLPGPPGHVACKILLNDKASLAAAVRDRDQAAIASQLLSAAQAALRTPKDRVVLSA